MEEARKWKRDLRRQDEEGHERLLEATQKFEDRQDEIRRLAREAAREQERKHRDHVAEKMHEVEVKMRREHEGDRVKEDERFQSILAEKDREYEQARDRAVEALKMEMDLQLDRTVQQYEDQLAETEMEKRRAVQEAQTEEEKRYKV